MARQTWRPRVRTSPSDKAASVGRLRSPTHARYAQSSSDSYLTQDKVVSSTDGASPVGVATVTLRFWRTPSGRPNRAARSRASTPPGPGPAGTTTNAWSIAVSSLLRKTEHPGEHPNFLGPVGEWTWFLDQPGLPELLGHLFVLGEWLVTVALEVGIRQRVAGPLSAGLAFLQGVTDELKPHRDPVVGHAEGVLDDVRGSEGVEAGSEALVDGSVNGVADGDP